MKRITSAPFRAYDIRGLVDIDFDLEWVERLGQACGTYFSAQGFGPAIVGHDCRPTSSGYAEALAKGMLSVGTDVTLIGMVPSPVFYYAVKKLGRRAGVIVTASHNPAEFNGFKIWGGESTIHTAGVQEIYQLMLRGDFPTGSGVLSELDLTETYIAELAASFNLKSKVKVVVDGGNGAGGDICAEVLRRMGAEVVPLYCEPDGTFPNHHPDPTVAANIRDLQRLVVETGARAGIGLDGDADRIGVVDQAGEILYGDRLLAIYARDVLSRHPDATVISEVKCSHLLFADIAAHGGKPIMGKTGHSLIKAGMLATGALLAGEISGHMFFADRYYGFDDAIYAAARLVEILADRPDTRLSDFLADWPKVCNTPELRIDCPDEIKFDIVERAQAHFKALYDVVDVDGVRIVFPDGWGLVRASNTQPVLVMRFEAETPERMEEIRSIVQTPIAAWIAQAGA